MNYRVELQEILTKNVPDIKGKDIYVWGTGNTAELYREGLLRLEEKEELKIAGYCDNNPAKWGTEFAEKPVISPKELSEKACAMVLIASPQPDVVNAIGKQLDDMCVEWFPIDAFIFKTHKDEILSCLDVLEDDGSKEVYCEVIKARMTASYPDMKYISDKQYFALRKFMGKNPKEVFVDCGAFVGDSLEQFVWERDGGFSKIIAYEPDMGNFKAMKCRVERLIREWNLEKNAIELYPYGVGEKSLEGRVDRNVTNNGLGSKISISGSDGGECCKIVALDDVIKESVTYLKADIESYEYKMILGAERLIQTQKPMLAICIYHNGVDMYSIPLLLKKLVPEYKMAVRHHSVEMDDTVLYAWI